eukprot:88514-Alexandrium_andersonii.AAC.1
MPALTPHRSTYNSRVGTTTAPTNPVPSGRTLEGADFGSSSSGGGGFQKSAPPQGPKHAQI